jgi:S-methylmethionine-dependent homocysteine/selenocysteine methylase
MKTLTSLPQLSGGLFLTDGGMETTLIFHDGIELPHFAAFPLLGTAEGRAALRKYYRTYAEMARRHRVGLVLESPTWRANPDWGQKLGYTPETLAQVNRDGVGLMHEIREEFEGVSTPVVISGCIGPRGDGYEPSALMDWDDAANYHEPQIRTLRDAGADFVSAFTMNYVEEAVGIAQAAAALEICSVISFTVETDGKLPTGQTLREAIETVDEMAGTPPLYYMINCAHPAHFEDAVSGGEAWLGRIRGIRANSSMLSHAELNECTDLDEGDPRDLGERHRRLLEILPQVNILGGCCGTDHRHVEAICKACAPAIA